MKFKTFRCIVALVALGLVGGGIFAFTGGGDDDARVPSDVGPTTPNTSTPNTSTPDTSDPDDPYALRPLDVKILARIEQGSISGTKLKDAFKSEAWKANLYQDGGHSKPNRVKVDLDRDDKWDEKWTFEDGQLKRQVSPSDDDTNYTVEYSLDGKRWSASADQAEAPAPDEPKAVEPAAGEGQALRSLDQTILGLVERGIPGDKLKDAFKGQSWKVNLYAEGGKVTRLKLDLDRDEKWDESWTFETPGSRAKVKRQVSPADDDNRSVEYRLQAGRWIKK